MNRSICRDERVWDDPDIFRPERFMGSSVSELADPYNIAFGHGRRFACYSCIRMKSHVLRTRLCAGRLFADTTLFLAISSMAATLDVRKARDSNGKEISPSPSWEPSFIRLVSAHYMLSRVIADRFSAIPMISCALLSLVLRRSEVLSRKLWRASHCNTLVRLALAHSTHVMDCYLLTRMIHAP